MVASACSSVGATAKPQIAYRSPKRGITRCVSFSRDAKSSTAHGDFLRRSLWDEAGDGKAGKKKLQRAASGHVWTAPTGQGIFWLSASGRVQVSGRSFMSA